MKWVPWVLPALLLISAVAFVLWMRRHKRVDAERRHCDPHEPSTEASEALRQAKRGLIDANRVDAAAQHIEAQLKEMAMRNHFREAVEDAMRRRAS